MRFGLRLFLRLRLCFLFLFLPEAREHSCQWVPCTVHGARDPHHFQRPHIGPAMALLVGLVYCLRYLQISLFNNFFIKIGSHGTVHIFKNYFIKVFSNFSFSNNKSNPNGLIESVGDALKVGF